MARIIAQRRLPAFALVPALALVSACGGGESGSGSPQPSNRAPTFTSPSNVSTAENTTGTVYTATADDTDNDAVTIAIAGGADAGAFSLTGAGLSFTVPRNFDRPTDANTDNTYEVSLSATDSRGGTSTLELRVLVTNDPEGVRLTRIATGFGDDAVIARRERQSGLIVISQDGSVHQVDAASGAITDIGNAFSAGETGRVLAVIESNGYGIAMLDIAGRGVVVRPILPSRPRPSNEEAMLATASTANARGALFLGGDGFLYAALGDPTGDLAQETGSGRGKLFRVQVDPYCGAAVGTLCVYGERFGDGLHAPAGGGAFGAQTFLVDRGTDQQEEINYFNQSARPLDFGWPFREGTLARVANPPAAVNGPSLTYGHGSGFFEGAGLTGTTLYSGAISSLTGQVLLTDQAGKIFAFPAAFLSDGVLHRGNEMENRTADFAPSAGAIERPIAILRDFAGRLIVLDGDGELYATN